MKFNTEYNMFIWKLCVSLETWTRWSLYRECSKPYQGRQKWICIIKTSKETKCMKHSNVLKELFELLWTSSKVQNNRLWSSQWKKTLHPCARSILYNQPVRLSFSAPFSYPYFHLPQVCLKFCDDIALSFHLTVCSKAQPLSLWNNISLNQS